MAAFLPIHHRRYCSERGLKMAPKKRQCTPTRKAGAASSPAIRVKCPACQKQVPSFFINSHLDLECLVLKYSDLSGRPETSSPPARPIYGHGTLSLDQLQEGAIRTTDSIGTKSSLDGGDAMKSPSSDKVKAWEDLADEDILKGTAANYKDSASKEANTVGAGYGSPERTLNCRATYTSEESDNEGISAKTKPRSIGTLLPYSSCHSVRQRKAREHGNSAWLGRPLKLTAPKGLQVLENFITAEEEEHLVHCLDTDIGNPWKLSRVNGIHQGKSYGNHIFGDFKRRVVTQVSRPMPAFVLPYVERMRDQVPALKDFFPNEMNSIDYRKGDGHYLKAHMDDRQLSGKVLVNLSLAGGCVMTYTREIGFKEEFRVKLSPQSLQVLTGQSRYSYYHGIQKNDIMDPRRVSMTFRQSVETSLSSQSSGQN